MYQTSGPGPNFCPKDLLKLKFQVLPFVSLTVNAMIIWTAKLSYSKPKQHLYLKEMGCFCIKWMTYVKQFDFPLLLTRTLSVSLVSDILFISAGMQNITKKSLQWIFPKGREINTQYCWLSLYYCTALPLESIKIIYNKVVPHCCLSIITIIEFGF